MDSEDAAGINGDADGGKTTGRPSATGNRCTAAGRVPDAARSTAAVAGAAIQGDMLMRPNVELTLR